MRILLVFLALSWLLFGGPREGMGADVNLGISIGEKGLKGFHIAVGEYYRVPEREVVVIKQRRIPDEEIPVVFFIAARARVSPTAIIDFRLGGKTWMEIAFHYGLHPDIFYVPVKGEVKGPPYGKAYGHFKNKARRESGRIVFKDEEVINLVNLKFISEHYGYPPEAVIKMRSEGKNFVAINDQVKRGDKGKEWKQDKEWKGDKEDKFIAHGKEQRGRGKGK